MLEVYEYSILLIFLLITSYLFFYKIEYVSYLEDSLENLLVRTFKRSTSLLCVLTLLIFALGFQLRFLNIELLDWDMSTASIISQDILRGNLPFENLWNNKGPVRFFLFSVPLLIKNSDPISFKLFNDLLYFFVALTIFLIGKSNGYNYIRSIISSMFFIFVTSQFGSLGSGYSEYYGLLFLGFALIYLSKNPNNKNIILASSFLSLALLTTPALIFHTLACLIYMFLTQKKYLKIILGFFTPLVAILLIYFNSNILDILLYNYLSPFEYASKFDFKIIDIFFETIFSPLSSKEMFLYGLVFLLGLFNVFNMGFELFKEKKLKIQSLVFILLGLSIGYFIFGGKGFHHHLIYFYFFFSLSIGFSEIKVIRSFNLLFLLGAYLTIYPFAIYQGGTTIKNFNYNNYPLFNDSVTISTSYTLDSGFALNDHLLFYYLDIPNSSFIVHPSDFRRHYSSDLVVLNRIKSNEIIYQFEKQPDIIICPKVQQFKIGKFETSCNSYFKNNSNYDTMSSSTNNSNIYLKKSAKSN